MDAICSFQLKYNLYSFLRDLLKIRAKTFTINTIKHSFRNAGIWLVSFKAVKKKLKEYSKKRKKDTGLKMLKYGFDNGSSSDEDIQPRLKEPSLVPDPQLNEEYVLPKLLKPLSLYIDYIYQQDELDEKISHALTSPSRARYKTAKAGTYKFLMLGGLAERDLEIAR